MTYEPTGRSGRTAPSEQDQALSPKRGNPDTHYNIVSPEPTAPPLAGIHGNLKLTAAALARKIRKGEVPASAGRAKLALEQLASPKAAQVGQAARRALISDLRKFVEAQP